MIAPVTPTPTTPAAVPGRDARPPTEDFAATLASVVAAGQAPARTGAPASSGPGDGAPPDGQGAGEERTDEEPTGGVVESAVVASALGLAPAAGSVAAATPATAATGSDATPASGTATAGGAVLAPAGPVSAPTDGHDGVRVAVASPSETDADAVAFPDGADVTEPPAAGPAPGVATARVGRSRPLPSPVADGVRTGSAVPSDPVSAPASEGTVAVQGATSAPATTVPGSATARPAEGWAEPTLSPATALPAAEPSDAAPAVSAAPPSERTDAPAPAAPAAPAEPSPPGSAARPAHEQVVSRVSSLRHAQDGSYALTVDLHPGELGRVRVEVMMQRGEVHLQLHAERGATDALLRGALSQLRAELESAGVRAGQLGVGGGSADGSGQHGERNGGARPGRGNGDSGGRGLFDEPTAHPRLASSPEALIDIRV